MLKLLKTQAYKPTSNWTGINLHFISPLSLTRFLLSLFFFCCYVSQIIAQHYSIEGQVIDAHSSEPIPFANIAIPNTAMGQTADFDGFFKFHLKQAPDSIAVSALGYTSLRFAYEQESELLIKLNAAAYNLNEITVRPTADPAIHLMQQVLAHKSINNAEQMDQFSCELYDKLELDLVNITNGFQNFWLNRPFKFAFEKIDSTSAKAPFLPVFLSEELSDIQYLRKNKNTKKTVKARRVSGLKNTSINEFLDILYQKINIYDNWIQIMTKKFVSPISDAGFNYYNYYLVDSAMIEQQWCYQIQFFKQSASSNTFSGDFWVHDSSYAIKRVNLNLFKDAGLNFVDQMNIVQTYAPFNKQYWQLSKTHTSIAFDKVTKPLMLDWFSKKIENNAPNVQGKRSSFYRHYTDSLLTTPNTTHTAHKTEAYWQAHRHIPLTASEQTAQQLIDTVQQLSVFKSWKRWTTLLFSGYMPLGIFDIGNFYNFSVHRPIEGQRLKLAIRTNARFSKKYLLGGYIAYGTADKRSKFGLNAMCLLPSSNRRVLRAVWLEDIRQTPHIDHSFSLSSEGFLSSNFIRQNKYPFKLIDLKNYQLNYFHQLSSDWSFSLNLLHQSTTPYFNFEYHTDASDRYEEAIINNYKHSSIALSLRYAHKEKFLAGVFNRTSLGSQRPIIQLSYEKGIKDILGAGFHFDRLNISITDRINIAPLGYLKTRIKAGKIWGRLPYLLLYTPRGNEGYFTNFDGFNLLPNFSFSADQYLHAAVDYHLDGFLFKKLPLLKKLNWRTVANYRLLWGSLSAKNKTANANNLFVNTSDEDLVRIQAPYPVPYMEGSVGIENIFRILRIDLIWKLSYLQEKEQNWGLRANLHIKF